MPPSRNPRPHKGKTPTGKRASMQRFREFQVHFYARNTCYLGTATYSSSSLLFLLLKTLKDMVFFDENERNPDVSLGQMYAGSLVTLRTFDVAQILILG